MSLYSYALIPIFRQLLDSKSSIEEFNLPSDIIDVINMYLNSSPEERFYMSIKSRNLSLIKFFFDRLAQPKYQQLLDIGLALAAKIGDMRIINFLIEIGVSNYSYAIVEAARYGHLDLVKFFLTKEKEQETLEIALEAAAISDNMEIIKLLLEKGANIEYLLYGAITAENIDLINFAIANGAANWFLALSAAVRVGNKELVQFFGKKIPLTFDDSETLITQATENLNFNIVDYLLPPVNLLDPKVYGDTVQQFILNTKLITPNGFDVHTLIPLAQQGYMYEETFERLINLKENSRYVDILTNKAQFDELPELYIDDFSYFDKLPALYIDNFSYSETIPKLSHILDKKPNVTGISTFEVLRKNPELESVLRIGINSYEDYDKLVKNLSYYNTFKDKDLPDNIVKFLNDPKTIHNMIKEYIIIGAINTNWDDALFRQKYRNKETFSVQRSIRNF